MSIVEENKNEFENQEGEHSELVKDDINLHQEKEFYELIKSPKLTVVYFWAPWCMPCKKFAPKYEAFANESSSKSLDFIMKKIDIDNESLQNIAIDYGIQSIPTLIAFCNGLEIGREIGVPDSLDLLMQTFIDTAKSSN